MSTINPVGNAAQIATNAIRKSQENLAVDAHAVANASTSVDSHETVKALVDARQQVVYTKAAAKVVRAADEMVSNLLNIRT